MKFYKYLIQYDNSDGPDYGIATEAELVAKLRIIAEDTVEYKCRSLPPDLVDAFDSGSTERAEYEFSNWMTGLDPHSAEFCLPPDDVTVSWEPEPRVQAFVDSLDAALTEADEMKSDGFPEPGWGPEARAAFATLENEGPSVIERFLGPAPFDPTQAWTPQKAADEINRQPDSLSALMAVVRFNVDHCEFGWVAELMTCMENQSNA